MSMLRHRFSNERWGKGGGTEPPSSYSPLASTNSLRTFHHVVDIVTIQIRGFGVTSVIKNLMTADLHVVLGVFRSI